MTVRTKDPTPRVPGTEVSSHVASVEGTGLHYLTAGEGRPLVLLHGGIIDAADISWRDLIGPLAAEAEVHALDLPGYGHSEMPDGRLTLGRHVQLVGGFLDELDLDDPVVAGLSMGGGIAVGLGLEYPERVAAVVPVDAFGLGRDLPNGLLTWLLAKIQVTNNVSVALIARSRRFTEASLASLVHDPDCISDALVDRVMAEARQPHAGAAFRKFRAAEVTRHGYRTDYSDRVRELSVPAHFVHGSEDDMFPAEWARRAADRAGADVTILDDCGHLATVEKPDAIRAVVAEML